MNWRKAYEWGRDILAIFGLLGVILATLAAVLIYRMERDYQERADAPPPPPSLETARTMIEQAGIRPHDARRLIAGTNPPLGLGPEVEAYCLEARVGAQDQGWQSIPPLDPLLADGARSALELAHSQLDCIPEFSQARARQLELKFMWLSYREQRAQSVRLALRDPLGGQVYLVDADELPPPRPVTQVIAPSIE